MNNTEKVYDIEMARDKKHQLANGYTRISNDILDDLIASCLSEVQLKIVLYVLRKTFGFQTKKKRFTQAELVKSTKLSRSAISRQLPILIAANVLEKSGGQRSEIAYQKYSERWIQSILSCASAHAEEHSTKTSAHAEEHSVRTQRSTQCARRGALKNSHLISLKETIKEKAAKAANTRAPARDAAAAACLNYEEIKKAYHELLPTWPEIKRITKERKENINLISDDLPTVNHWRDYFEFVSESEFLIKKKKQRLDFDFLIDENRFSQIWEGKYHD